MTDESESEPPASGAGQPPGPGDGSDARDVDSVDGNTTARTNAAAEQSSVTEDGGFDSVGPGAVEDPSEIDPSELTVARRSLHPRIRIIWVVKAIVTALIAGGLAQLADTYVFGVGLIVPVSVALALLVLGVTHALLRYRVWSYEVREDALYLERGVVTRVRTVVPFVRIQHVDTSRGPIERATGLATSVVYTAGSRGADVTIPGLEADRADDLQHRLKRLAIASEADTAV